VSRVLTYVEIDQSFCANTYGSAPCTASVPTTGAIKCFNTVKTCQDPDNFVNEPVTLRFGVDVDYLPIEIDCIPSIQDWSVSPSIISLGEDLGLRAEMRVTFKDHPWSDTGPGGDKYLSDRPYDPFKLGTYWGKWRARVQWLKGQPIRLIHGYLGQSFAEMETRHYVVESVDGPTPDGSFTIIAKDPLKLLDGDRAQAPIPNNGFLIGDITDSAGSFTLAPAGVGNAEYPTSGYINIGNSEICAFTRSGDTVTLTARAQFGTEAKAHSAQDRAQVVLEYIGQDVADIIYDLMVNYAGVSPVFISLADWKAETENFLRRVYSAALAQPTSCKQLISELIEQAALSIWWDDVGQRVRLRVLREISTSAEIIGPEVIQQGSFQTREQPGKRVSQVWVHYGLRNPLLQLTDETSYRSIAVTLDADNEANYGSPAIKKIYSRWIATGGRTVAARLGDIILGRYKDPPRRFNFDLLRGVQDLEAGQGYQVTWWTLQDVTGAQTTAPIQVTRFNPRAAEIGIEAEEQLFARIDPEDLDNRTIILDANILNFNFKTAHDLLYPPVEAGNVVRCYIETGVVVGSSVFGSPAFDVGTWPAGVTLEIYNNGRIQGRGGKGGNAAKNGVLAQAGEAGGLAFYTRQAVLLDNSSGRIYGGGGGGGGGAIKDGGKFAGGGGGGAGFNPGLGGATGNGSDNEGKPGTLDFGGAGGIATTSGAWSGGNGGGPAQAGANPGGGASGGAAGRAVDGNSFITFTATGDIRGARIN
jgi:hypothetical protein